MKRHLRTCQLPNFPLVLNVHKAVSLHAMETHGGRGGIAPTPA
jgi:hypothetical protein